jgi:hypothetical protein
VCLVLSDCRAFGSEWTQVGPKFSATVKRHLYPAARSIRLPAVILDAFLAPSNWVGAGSALKSSAHDLYQATSRNRRSSSTLAAL